MARIPVIERDDGLLEAEGVVFAPPVSGWGAVGCPTAGAIFDGVFQRLLGAAQQENVRLFDREPRNLFVHSCDDCGGLYLDGRSDNWRGYRAKRRCPGCFARQRYRYVQRSRSRRRTERQPTACAFCGTPLVGRLDRKFCAAKCRVAAHRARHAGSDPVGPLA